MIKYYILHYVVILEIYDNQILLQEWSFFKMFPIQLGIYVFFYVSFVFLLLNLFIHS